MTGKPPTCPDDLLAQASRGQLSELERRALTAHAVNCPECRAAMALAAMLHTSSSELPGDADVIARVASRAGQGWPRRHPRPHGRALAVAAAIAFVCVVTGAAAVVVTWTDRKDRPRQAYRPAVADEPVATRPGAGTPVSARPVSGGQEAAPTVARAPDHKRWYHPVASALPVQPPAPEPVDLVTPAALFSEANAVRAQGDLMRAAELYLTLRRRFPDAREAILSAISLGKIRLSQGDADGALAAFDAYLARRPPGPLVEEALVGRGRALKLLGRTGEERATWEQLLSRFQGTAYESLARQRLSDLPR